MVCLVSLAVGWYVNWLCYNRYVNSLMSVIVHLLTLSLLYVVCGEIPTSSHSPFQNQTGI